MQRRITIALLSIALAAVVLVGFGVLGLSGIGAEREARERVEAQLEAVGDLVDRTSESTDVGPAIGRLGDALGNSTIAIGRVDPVTGEVGNLRTTENRDLGPALDDDDLAQLLAGEIVFTRVDGQLRGVEAFDISRPGRQTAVVVVQRQIATIPREARAWFLLSAAVVLVGAALASSALASRFVKPIRRSTAATQEIASGNLDVRVPVEGSDEIADLGASINAMAAELERGRAAEQQFLLSVSHDLRTPLTALRGFGEALEDGTVTDTERAGAVISHNAARLSRLVGDLLDLGKLEARQFRFDIHNFDAAEVVAATATGLAPAATAERSIDVRVEAPAPVIVSADPDRTGQAVANLVENAVAFAATTVTVSAVSNGSHAMVTVTDDGPGIAAVDLPHVFERLYVTKLVPQRSESSSGLGLAIVRELVTAMGGEIEATSPPGGGTSMVMRLPLATEGPTAS